MGNRKFHQIIRAIKIQTGIRSEQQQINDKKIATKIKRNSPLAIGKAIKAVNAGFIDGINGYEVEKKEFGACFGSAEFKEGISAFMEKRKANF